MVDLFPEKVDSVFTLKNKRYNSYTESVDSDSEQVGSLKRNSVYIKKCHSVTVSQFFYFYFDDSCGKENAPF